MINIYLDRIFYYNIIIKNNFIKYLLKDKKDLMNILSFFNNKINGFLFFNILNFFLILKKNLFKILKNKKLIVFQSKIKRCQIIL
jgi:hypothetical protein